MIDKILGVVKDKEEVKKLKSKKLSQTIYEKRSITNDYDAVKEFTKSNYEKFRLLIRTNEICIIGSVRKFMANYNNSNLLYYNPTKQDIEDFAGILKEELGISIGNMEIYQQEFGVSFETERKVKDYLDTLIFLPYTKKNNYGNNGKKFSYSYSNRLYKATSLNLYDNAKIRNNYKDNVIRIEVATPKNLRRKLGLDSTLLYSDYFEEEHWALCKELMLSMLEKIKTKRKVNIDDVDIRKPSDIENFLIDLFLSEEANQDTLERLIIESSQSNPDFDKVNLLKQIEAIRKNQSNQTTNSNLKQELIDKVRTEFDYMIAN